MLTDATVQALLVPQESLAEHEQGAYELAKRQALDVVVVRHLSRQLHHQTLPDFCGFSKLFATCVSSNLGNMDVGNNTRDINCYAVCVEGGVYASSPRALLCLVPFVSPPDTVTPPNTTLFCNNYH
jgi:hypothetical protein